MNSMLENYTSFINFFSKALGPDYEVFYMDTTSSQRKIVAHRYGKIIREELSENIAELIDEVIECKEYEKSDYITNRMTYAKDGKMLRTSIFFVKDERNILEGIMCINFDDSRYEQLSQKIMTLCHPDGYYEGEQSGERRFAVDSVRSGGGQQLERTSIEDTIELLVDEELIAIEIPVSRLTAEEKIEIIKRLDSKGVFMMKGAVNIMSKRLDISQASVYRYINIARE